jgi:hypothetical protein
MMGVIAAHAAAPIKKEEAANKKQAMVGENGLKDNQGALSAQEKSGGFERIRRVI